MSLIALDPDDVHDLVTERDRRLGAVRRPGSASARPGPCCCRGAGPTGASRSGSSASGRPSCSRWPASTPRFPIVLETVRECVQDVFDVPGLVRADARRIGSRAVRLVEVETPQPSPFARSLLFGYVAQFLYEGDSPLAERRAAALSLDPTPARRAARPGRGRRAARPARPGGAGTHRGRAAAHRAGAALPVGRGRRRPAPGARPAAAPGHRGPVRRGHRRQGGLGLAGRPRGRPPADPGPDRRRGALGGRRGRRPAARRAGRGAAGGRARGVPRAGRRPARRPGRPLRPHPRPVHRRTTSRPGSGSAPPSSPTPCAGWSAPAGWSRASCARSSPAAACTAATSATPRCCGRCAAARWRRCAPRSSRCRPSTWPASCRPGRASAPACAAPRACCARSSSWPAPSCPASALETLVLPARVAGYTPALLDELTASGEVLWRGHGALPGDDGWVSLHLAETAPPDPARPVRRARADRGPPRRARRARRRRRVLLPHALRRRRQHRRPGACTADAVGPGLGRARSPTTPSRRCGPCSPAAAPRTSRAGRHRAPRATPAGPRRWARCPGDGPAPAGRRCRPAPVHPPRPGAGRCCRRPRPTRRCAPTPPPRCCSTATAS